jgi:deoxyribose-phosphate aldolase
MPEVKIEAAADAHLPSTYEDLSKIMELPVLAPEITEEEIHSACDLARLHGLATVTVRPSDIDLAAHWTGSFIALGAAVDWPHGYSTTAVKQYAVRDALRRGAKEITVTMNTGKLISRQFQYLEMELLQIADACHEAHALLSVNLESGHLSEEHKIVACRISKRAGVDFLATPEPLDIPLLRQHARDRIQLKLRGAPTLESALEGFRAECARIETPNAIEILKAWKTRITPEVPKKDE